MCDWDRRKGKGRGRRICVAWWKWGFVKVEKMRESLELGFGIIGEGLVEDVDSLEEGLEFSEFLNILRFCRFGLW